MKILVTGATGQIGSELMPHLREKFPKAEIIAANLPNNKVVNQNLDEVFVVQLDVSDMSSLRQLMNVHKPEVIYHLAGILSATGERDPQIAWNTNVLGLKNVLDCAVEQKTKKIFWPSSIAAFGKTTPKENTPQRTVMEPNTMYGLNKVAGELLCQYYVSKYGLDIRSVRFPGIVSYKTVPGGGTTDYAVDMFYKAVLEQPYTCFVSAETILPMMYMDDAIRAIDLLMDAPVKKLTVHTSYNLGALNFSAAQLASAIQNRIPSFVCKYVPDYRQQIANTWPRTIDDSQARGDWDWNPSFDLDRMVSTMLEHLRQKLKLTHGSI